MSALKLVVVSAGLSVPSSTRMLADALTEAVRAAALPPVAPSVDSAVEVRVLELRELAMDVAQVMVTGMPAARVEDALDALEAADAVIAVTPIFAGSYSGVFKSFFDLVGTERLAGRPVLLSATGGSARHSLAIDHALRPLFSALRAHVVPTAVYAANEDFGAAWGMPAGGVGASGAGSGGVGSSAASGIAERIRRAGAELVALVNAVRLPARHQWRPDEADAAGQSRVGNVAPGVGTTSLVNSGSAIGAEGIPATVGAPAAVGPVGAPGAGSTAPLLKSDGTSGRLRPDLADFVPMTELFGQR